MMMRVRRSEQGNHKGSPLLWTIPFAPRSIVGAIPCGRPRFAIIQHCRVFFIVLFLTMMFSSCAFGGQQGQQPDPRLKSFAIVSARIIMLDNSAEVDGMVQNNGHEQFPFDVTIAATFYDGSGKVIGQAQGVAEDVFPGMTRPFILVGQVNSTLYSHMRLAPVSLRERRLEKNIPTPTPVVP